MAEFRLYAIHPPRFIAMRDPHEACLLFSSSARTPAYSPRVSLTYRDKPRSLDSPFESDENEDETSVRDRSKGKEGSVAKSRLLPSPHSGRLNPPSDLPSTCLPLLLPAIFSSCPCIQSLPAASDHSFLKPTFPSISRYFLGTPEAYRS